MLFAVQFVSAQWIGLENAQHILGLNRSDLFSGNILQLFTYPFIHGDGMHLALNAIALLILGSKVEHIIPKRTFKQLGAYAVIAGGVLFLLLSPSSQTLVGASPVCFALLLMLVTLSPDSRFLPVFLTGKTLGIGIMMIHVVLATVHPDLPTGPLAESGRWLAESFPDLFKTSHACHLGGALVGWIYGVYLLRPRITLETLRKQRASREDLKRN
jgi:membrane associated rhomboid family serine protease